MKTVFRNSSEVIHMFAQRTQNEGRCSNVFFYGDKIYSYGYHYLLGEFIDANTIVINDSGYSNTTNKHIYELKYATRQYKQFIMSETDISKVHSSIVKAKDKLANARKPELYISEINYLWSKLNEFIKYRKDKNTVKHTFYREIKSIVSAIQKDAAMYQQKLFELKKKQEESKKRKDAKRLKESLAKFNAYEISSFRIGDKDYLRISQDGTLVETSQHVSVDIEDAAALYELIARGIDIKGHRIGNYTVTSINGTLKIGCHNIDMESVHKVGNQLQKQIA